MSEWTKATDYQSEYPATYRAAVRLIRSARRRAPSFVFLNMIFEAELEQFAADEDTREAIKAAAREYLRKEAERDG